MIDELMTFIDCNDLGLTAYLNTENEQVVTDEGSLDNMPFLSRIPTRKELLPYREAIRRYADANSLVIPDYAKPAAWLRGRNLYDDFLAFYDDLVKVELENWYKEQRLLSGRDNDAK